ncbi:phage head closure protein [Enterobacter cloacae]|uniref:phage head closure protein n=1 Tax=Enterobacter cloacae TaxID=550 RepID=UPI00100EBB33|nr:phage head closure protein [Enterobacter cloacae]MCM7399107.1 phage head closure protein [Enterobacter cloacae]QGN44390.1 phage head closure protein [Enterobacter cloacae]RXX62383.1 head-tail adaptor [Enterobacter cloacae]HDT3786028.1 phage head closure protein [Enterobacter hormaechei subsp. steigerwaltii]
MKPGRLKHRVTLQRFESGRGPLGEPVTSWVDYATVWAEVKGISGRELATSGSLLSDATLRIWIRFRSDVKQGQRVLCHTSVTGGDVFGIVAAIPDNNRTSLELLCKGGVSDD